MTVKEMHIDLEQGVQRLASNVNLKISDEQKDFFLNKNQLRYIKSKVDNYNKENTFEDKQKHLDDIQAVLQRNYLLDAYLSNDFAITTSTNLSNKETYTILPSDYLYLVADKSIIYDDCHTISDNLNATQNVYKTLHVVPFYYGALTSSTSNPYADFKISFNSKDIFKPANGLPGLSASDVLDKNGQRYLLGYQTSSSDNNWGTGYPNTKSAFYVINHVLQFLNAKSTFANPIQIGTDLLYNVYWERYDEYYYPNCFLFVTNAPSNVVSTNTFTITFNGSNTSTSILKILLTNKIFSIDGTFRQVSNRLTKTQFAGDVNINNVFYKTLPDSPNSTLIDDKLIVHFNEKFIIKKVLLDYIRQPRLISLKLNQECELTSSVHPEIVDLTIEYIKKTIKDPDWEIKVQDNIQRGNLN